MVYPNFTLELRQLSCASVVWQSALDWRADACVRTSVAPFAEPAQQVRSRFFKGTGTPKGLLQRLQLLLTLFELLREISNLTL